MQKSILLCTISHEIYAGRNCFDSYGHEVIGVINKHGTSVSQYSIGIRVGVGWSAGITYDGLFSEYMVTGAENLILIPYKIDGIEGACPIKYCF